MGAGDTREEMAIVGKTPNVAARLEGLAEPGSVLISESTHSLIEGLFVCETIGPQSLKGRAMQSHIRSLARHVVNNLG